MRVVRLTAQLVAQCAMC